MQNTHHGFFEDVWFGFHVLFLAVVVTVAFVLFSGHPATSQYVVKGPLGAAAAGILGRNLLRHLN